MPTSIPSSTLEKFITFGDLLRFLRRRCGLTQMELAFAVGYSNTQISRLEQNERLPDIPTIEARFVSALGLEDEPKAVARLLDLAANVRREDAPAAGLSPYKGLKYFDESDADVFVGREVLTSKLTERVLALASRTSSGVMRFLAIVGASGSGKSSLVRAGLVSALRWNKASTDWHIHILTPTAHPLENLAATLTQESNSVAQVATFMDDLLRDPRSLQIFAKRKLGSKNSTRLLLIVDQFEELFSLCRSEEERIAWIDNLLSAASEVDGPVILVITLRADFYAPCANYPGLRDALAGQQEYIGAMGEDELRRAIEEPARRGRWEFEPGLVDLLLHDVGHEPGALPLLSHALFETWQRRRGRTLTLSGYTSSGGVRGAIAETAEAVFADQFTHEQQRIARRIFLRLTELGDETGAGDTRRRAAFTELILKPEETANTQVVLKALADARLIITSEDSAEVAHEALIREWPTLHGWLEENREGLRLHRQLTEAAQDWSDANQEPDLLYRGTRLAQARDWASMHQEEMNALEIDFLAASIKTSEYEAAERESQQRRELEASQKLANTERARAEEQAHSANRLRTRNRLISGVGIIAVLLAILAGIFGFNASHNAQKAQENLLIANRQQVLAQNAQATAQAASTQTIADFTRSEAQRLAAEANSLKLSHGDPNLIALLTIRSLNLQYTSSGDALLTSLTSLEAPPRIFSGHTNDVWGVAFSPDGKYLASGSSDGTARMWDLANGETVRVFEGHAGEVSEVQFSPDGKTLLVGSVEAAHLWDIASGQLIQVFSGIRGGGSVAFSPDGKYMVTASFDDKNAQLWDVATGESLRTFQGDGEVIRVAYSPNGEYLLTGSVNFTARLWNPTTGEEIKTLTISSGIESLAFSPDSTSVAFGTSTGEAQIWSIDDGKLVHQFSGHQGYVQGIKFSPDGKTLLTGCGDRTIRLWDINTGQLLRLLGSHSAGVQGVAFSADGSLGATASEDETVKVWSLQTFPGGLQFRSNNGPIWQASFSPDRRQVVTASDNGTGQIWDSMNGRELVVLRGHAETMRGAVFSPDGKMVLTTSADHTARLWDASTGKELRWFEGHTDLVNRGLFFQDGRHIITTSYDGTARVWDMQTGQTILTYANQDTGHVNRIVFSPDGKTVATSGDDGTVHIWDPHTAKDRMILKHQNGVTGLAFSADGSYLVTCSFDGSVHLWQVDRGEEVRQFAGHPGGAFGAAFSPDGKYVLTSGIDTTARLWDVQTGEEIRRFSGHASEVRDVSFSPDGKYILTASNDGTARLWLADLQDTILAACTTLTRDLTPEERSQFGVSDQGPTCLTQ
jgi:WD40 repeat protein/transcriptional regulator with XRE-family HTH domain